jgi:hypothetical protein
VNPIRGSISGWGHPDYIRRAPSSELGAPSYELGATSYELGAKS